MLESDAREDLAVGLALRDAVVEPTTPGGE